MRYNNQTANQTVGRKDIKIQHTQGSQERLSYLSTPRHLLKIHFFAIVNYTFDNSLTTQTTHFYPKSEWEDLILAARRRSVTLGSDSRLRLSFTSELFKSSSYNKKRRQTPSFFPGRSERIWTSGLLVPNQALYQTEPHPDKYFIFRAAVIRRAEYYIAIYWFCQYRIAKNFFATTKFSHFAVALAIAHPFMI